MPTCQSSGASGTSGARDKSRLELLLCLAPLATCQFVCPGGATGVDRNGSGQGWLVVAACLIQRRTGATAPVRERSVLSPQTAPFVLPRKGGRRCCCFVARG